MGVEYCEWEPYAEGSRKRWDLDYKKAQYQEGCMQCSAESRSRQSNNQTELSKGSREREATAQ